MGRQWGTAKQCKFSVLEPDFNLALCNHLHMDFLPLHLLLSLRDFFQPLSTIFGVRDPIYNSSNIEICLHWE